MRYSMIAIGDELLLGQVTDTNSGSIARMLDPEGWQCRSVQVVHDTAGDIRGAVSRALAESDVVLLTGGLGPTKDDITKSTLAEMLGCRLRLDAPTLANVEEVMRANGREINELTRSQAMVPDGCRVIQNRVGTAPIMWFDLPDGKTLVSMPGVPHETLTMMREAVVPQLLDKHRSAEAVGHRVAIITDLSESLTAMRLQEWEESLPPHLHLAYLPKARLIRLRLDGKGPDRESLNKDLDREFEAMLGLLKGHVAARSDVSLAEALVNSARAAALTIATAESCTGGNIAREITQVAGCSDVMLGGVVSYANSVKEGVLGVRGDTLAAHGAVSTEVVREMLAGVMRATGATLAMATSGVAGPSGGTAEKPVGTVVVGAQRAGGEPRIEVMHFRGDRVRVIDGATAAAMTMALHLAGE